MHNETLVREQQYRGYCVALHVVEGGYEWHIEDRVGVLQKSNTLYGTRTTAHNAAERVIDMWHARREAMQEDARRSI